jgi:hypothetical protein
VAYDEELAERVRALVPAGSDEVRMFGGIAFMVGGNMACAVGPQGLLVRVGRDGYDAALAAGAEPMVMGGRTMRGYVRVTPPDDLAHWVATGVAVARALPTKRR